MTIKRKHEKFLIFILCCLIFIALLINVQHDLIYASKNEWRDINNGLYGGFIHGIAIDFVDHNTVYCATWHGIYKSSDGGKTWKLINNGLLENDIFALKIDPIDNKVLYASGWYGLYKSTNSGDSWKYISSGIECKDIRSIAISYKNNKLIFVGTACGDIYKSTDAGQ